MAGVYVISKDGSLIELQERPYDSEAALQELLAKYPSLLAGGQVDNGPPQKLVLVAREMGLASEEYGADRWSVDHLFLDQEGIPTIVEVKRSSDSRIRREVIGQMLDYAANGVRYWPVETLQARFEKTCEVRHPEQGPGEVLADALSLDDGSDAVATFWSRVKTNLQAGRIRMVFVADEIPAELARVVEFLNTQMDPADVLAIEVKQFANDSLKTLVPRVIGQTAEAQIRKGAPPRQWDEPSFFRALEERRGKREASTCRQILRWGESHGLKTWWGQGARDGSFFLRSERLGCDLISAWTYGRVEIQFQKLSLAPPFSTEDKRLHLLNLLNEIPGVALRREVIGLRPSISLDTLAAEGALTNLFTALEYVVGETPSSEK